MAEVIWQRPHRVPSPSPWGWGPQSNAMLFGSPEVSTPNITSIRFAVFAQRARMTDRLMYSMRPNKNQTVPLHIIRHHSAQQGDRAADRRRDAESGRLEETGCNEAQMLDPAPQQCPQPGPWCHLRGVTECSPWQAGVESFNSGASSY